MLQAAGFAATRVPLSGAAGSRFRDVVTTQVLGHDLVVEVKARRRFVQLYAWIDGADVLVVQGDRQQPLVVVRLRFALDVAVAAERGRR
jgi:Holliday junction resolvase